MHTKKRKKDEKKNLALNLRLCDVFSLVLISQSSFVPVVEGLCCFSESQHESEILRGSKLGFCQNVGSVRVSTAAAETEDKTVSQLNRSLKT